MKSTTWFRKQRVEKESQGREDLKQLQKELNKANLEKERLVSDNESKEQK